MKILAKKLRELRKDLKLSQTEVAKKLGLQYFTYGKWEQEKAEPSANDLVKLAEIFDVTVDYLLGRTDELGEIAPGNNVSSGYTAAEQRLIQDYRTLDEEQRKAVRIVLDMFVKDKDKALPASSKRA